MKLENNSKTLKRKPSTFHGFGVTGTSVEWPWCTLVKELALWCKIQLFFQATASFLAQRRFDRYFPKKKTNKTTELWLSTIRFKKLCADPGTQGKESNNRPFQRHRLKNDISFSRESWAGSTENICWDVIAWSINEIILLELKADLEDRIPMRMSKR